MTWQVPKNAWNGEPCYILGGGPSLKNVDVAALNGRIIAINNAYLLRPNADILYFSDRRWYEWNVDVLDGYRGSLMVTRSKLKNPKHDVNQIKRDTNVKLSRDPGKLAGYCGGANALNLAFLLGCDPIVLVGFDLTGNGNWHDLHRKASSLTAHQRFIPYFFRMAPELKRESVTVLNASSKSALTCFPHIDLASQVAV